MSHFEMFRNETSIPCRAGDVIFAIGDAAHSMYVIAEGEVEIRIGDALLDHLGPGAIFGEMALVAGEKRSAAALAATDCRLVEISEKRFLFLVQQTPFFALEVMRVLAARLRRKDPHL
jgi:CRP-like cAMP-binding protein